ncbi:Lacal_2735 family protein [Algoriphagus persicinus]|uniref:Lacal_2735 family protein n=1 Tax=Algoriphagus persicinus TaxID=3108754 RepID=UPI002B3AFC2F|nr:Lacal_2735 family protein [Algoriphagus sp. E1-3-M2]MEB2785429.1 Lacal_2735 family protein [Algoriphagus sp. E1-3-M2]
MFGLFKKKSEKEKLQEMYSKKLAEVHQASQVNRKEADRLASEAEEIAKKIDLL